MSGLRGRKMLSTVRTVQLFRFRQAVHTSPFILFSLRTYKLRNSENPL